MLMSLHYLPVSLGLCMEYALGKSCLSSVQIRYKLGGVGPVDNRPLTNQLHHIVKKKM